MRKKRFILFALALIFMMSTVLSGCSNSIFGGSIEETPQSILEDAYGNKQFKITFSSEGLESPLEDMTYTASAMPTLPTPERIGYIFEGWYLDSDYTIPYLDGILYLYMSDVTLYAKWSKEDFAQDGTYDIEFEAHIVEGTVVEGSMTEQYGGYRDFSNDIIADETFIQKSEDGLRLQLKFDSGSLPEYLYADTYPVYTVNISSAPQYKTSARIDTSLTIDSYSDSAKTYYINIDDFDIAQPLYLDISYINWEKEDIELSDRAATLTTYTVEFNITKLIGFSQSFANPDATLEDGYYLAKTYYRSEDNTANMGASFNPVYSYILAENGNYTLVKPFIPYAGLVSSGGESDRNDYYERLMTFMPVQLYYDVDTSEYGEEEVTSEYYPETYHAGQYGDFVIEFNAETGKSYAIYDLGSDLKQEYMVMSATTGFMEYNWGTGAGNQILSIDYDHLIKKTEIDYIPLDGDAYSYETEMQYYPGDVSDLNEKNYTYEATEEYGLSTDMVNFFYSAPSSNSPYSQRTMYSSRITVSPKSDTTSKAISDSRYSIAHFSINAQVFGYDVQSGENLYADTMEVSAFGDSAMRKTKAVRIGKSYNEGDTVQLASLYSEKVDSSNKDLTGVSYKAYELKDDGSVDWSKEYSLSGISFRFEKNIVVLFTSERKDEDGNIEGINTSLVEIVEYEEPDVSVSNYNPDKIYKIGEEVAFPNVEYTWMGNEDHFIDVYYESYDGTKSMAQTTVAYFIIEDGVYNLTYPIVRETTFEISGEKITAVYELRNVYGEREYRYYDFSSQEKDRYTITDSEGEVLVSEDVRYDSSDIRLSEEDTYSYYLADVSLSELPRYYYSIGNGEKEEYILKEYEIYARDSVLKQKVGDPYSEEEVLADINNFIERYGQDYAFGRLIFEHTGTDGITDSFTVGYLFNATISGQKKTDWLNYKDYFTGYEYTIAKPSIVGADGLLLKTGSISIQKYNGTELMSEQNSKDTYELSEFATSYKLIFSEKGKYRIGFSYYLRYDENGDWVFSDKSGYRVEYYQEIEVIDGNGDVTITYVTDAEHPFRDGSTQKEYTFNLNEAHITPSNSDFNYSGSDKLFGWIDPKYDFTDTDYLFEDGVVLADFIGSFNAQNVTLKAIWDKGITVTGKIDDNNVITSNKIYLNSSGYYNVDISDFALNASQIPTGKVFLGWTGGFIGDEVVTSGNYKIRDVLPENLTITAVFSDQYTVKYDMNTSYTDETGDHLYTTEFFGSETVLSNNPYIADPESKMKVSCNREGYEFKGWYVQGDESQTLVDLSKYEVTGNVTFVALFGPIEE